MLTEEVCTEKSSNISIMILPLWYRSFIYGTTGFLISVYYDDAGAKILEMDTGKKKPFLKLFSLSCNFELSVVHYTIFCVFLG